MTRGPPRQRDASALRQHPHPRRGSGIGGLVVDISRDPQPAVRGCRWRIDGSGVDDGHRVIPRSISRIGSCVRSSGGVEFCGSTGSVLPAGWIFGWSCSAPMSGVLWRNVSTRCISSMSVISSGGMASTNSSMVSELLIEGPPAPPVGSSADAGRPVKASWL